MMLMKSTNGLLRSVWDTYSGGILVALVVAIAAIGVKTSLASVLKVKPSYIAILVIETLFLLVIAVLFVLGFGLGS